MDSELLKYEIKKKKSSIDELSKKLGISKSAFYRKLNGKSDFTLKEVQKMVKLLSLESPIPIFFAL